MSHNNDLEKLLERLERARNHYKNQDVKAFRKDIYDIGRKIYDRFSNVKGVFSVGYPHYTPDGYVPNLLYHWFDGKLGFLLDSCNGGTSEKMKLAYEAAREDIDLFFIVNHEDGLGFERKTYAEIDQRQLTCGEDKILDIQALDRLVYNEMGIHLYAYTPEDENVMVIDTTVIPKKIWFDLEKDSENWLNKKKWGPLGIDIMFSMVTLAADPNYNFIDKFRYEIINTQEGKTLSEKIDNIQLPQNTAHSELLRDSVVY